MKNIGTLICIFLIIGCQKFELFKGAPDCLVVHLEYYDEIICEEGAFIKRYSFQNKPTYLVYNGCGADYEEVLDSNCNSLGSLGGIAGNNDINGEKYYGNAIFECLIWESKS